MKQKVIAIIEARMGSTRLPNKVMLRIMGKPMLEHIVRRLQTAERVNQVVIATSTNLQDKTVVDLAKKLKVGWFRGSESDVLDRVLKAAKKYYASHIVECWGDCPFVDPKLIDQVVDVCLQQRVDFAANNTLKKEVPIGLDVMVFPTLVLEKVSQLSDNPYDHEHVSLYIYEHPKTFRIKHISTPTGLPVDGIRLVVDTEKDLELTKRIYHILFPKNHLFGYQQIRELYQRFPKLFTINRDIVQKKAHYTRKDEIDIGRKVQSGRLSFVPKYRAGIVGCGNIAGLFSDDRKRLYVASHAEAYQLNPDLALVAVSEIDKLRLRTFQSRWDIHRAYVDYRDMFGKEKLDIVSICTKPEVHMKVVQDAIRAKIPDILCEKPFGTAVADAEKTNRLAKKNGVTLIVHYNRRFDPLHQQLQQDVAASRYGKFIGGIHYYCNGFINNGCHAINLIQMLFGPVKTVQTVGVDETGGTVNFDVVLTLASNQRIILKSVTGSHYLFESEFLFEKKKIRIEKVGGKFIESDYDGVSNATFGRSPESLPAVFDYIFSLKKKRQEPVSSAEDSIATQVVLVAACLSYERKCQVVTLPLNPKEKTYRLKEHVISK